MRSITKLTVLVLFLFALTSCGGGGDSLNDNSDELSTLSGLIQKGPFVQNSRVTVQELDNELNPVISRSYETSIDNNLGAFYISNDLTSNYIEIITSGFYFNEVSGGLSSANITLRALTNLSNGNTANINILTTLTQKRIKHLVVEQGVSFVDAVIQSEIEILNVFNIHEDEVGSFASMDISENNNSGAILLAVSVSLQGNSSVADLSEFLANLISDLEEDGIVDDENLIAKIQSNSVTLNLSDIRRNIENRYSSLGFNADIPQFEDFIDSDGDGVINKYDYTLLSPTENTNISMPHFDWSDSNLTNIKYHFQLSIDNTFGTIIVEDVDLVDSEYQLNELLTNGVYYWRVFLVKNEIENNWAEIKEFTVNLGTVSLQTPAGVIGNSGPTFEWSDIDLQNVKYHFQIASDDSFANIVEDVNNITESSYAITSVLDNLTTYYWRVAVIDENGVQGSWANSLAFTTDLAIIIDIDTTDIRFHNSTFWTGTDIVILGEKLDDDASSEVYHEYNIVGYVYNYETKIVRAINTANAPVIVEDYLLDSSEIRYINSKIVIIPEPEIEQTGWVYDVVLDSWSILPSLSDDMERICFDDDITISINNSKLFLFNNSNEGGCIFNTETDTWTTIEPYPVDNVSFYGPSTTGSVVSNNLIMIDSYGQHGDIHEGIYNLTTETWGNISTTNMPYEVYTQIPLLHNNNIILFGGYDGIHDIDYPGYLNTIYSYDVNMNIWSTFDADLILGLEYDMGLVFDDYMLILGFDNDNDKLLGSIYDFQTNNGQSVEINSDRKPEIIFWEGEKINFVYYDYNKFVIKLSSISELVTTE